MNISPLQCNLEARARQPPIPAPSADRFCGGSLTCVSRRSASGPNRASIESASFQVSLVTNARDAAPRGSFGVQIDFRQVPC